MITIDMSWLCLALPLIFMTAVAIMGTRARIRHAQRLRQALQSGAFADPSSNARLSRYRPLFAAAALGILVALASVLLLVLATFGVPSYPPRTLLAIAVVAMLPSFHVGIIMSREISRVP